MIARFVLIQDDVLGVSEYLSCLPWGLIDEERVWRMAMGTINEFNEHEIVGIVAEAYPTFYEDTWIISSPFDKPQTVVPIQPLATMPGLIRGRLDRIYRGGVYEGDLCNLPQSVIARGVCTKAPQPEEVY